MARKDLLKGLLGPSDPAQRPAPANPRMSTGAVGAVSRSIADLKARSVIEIDPWLIEAAGMTDRLESDLNDDAELSRSIATYGQQVPVLVRPHPTTEGRFQIVYGRRRVLALRDIGQPVKALVRDLDDRELVLAQGQENTARRDLSFIEKVNFARQMVDAGYDRKVICDALSIDKTLISRMLSIAERVPVAVIEAVGSAPSVGRDRWLAVADMIIARDEDAASMCAMIALTASGESSDTRFDALHDYLAHQVRRDTPPRAVDRLRAHDGLHLGDVSRGASTLTLRLHRARTDGFEDWLVQHLSDLHRDWLAARGEDTRS